MGFRPPVVVAVLCGALLGTASLEAASATNPVIWADVPDPAVIRVGDTYYMSSTTMHMSPGLPIMKSADLVSWELVGYAYGTLGDEDALTLENGESAYGAGSWASSLRHHDGTFYVSTFSSTTGKTHVYTTHDIERGPWEEISFAPSLHDHSLVFDDDGRVYALWGVGDLRLTELSSDLSGLRPGGFDEVVIPDASLVASPRERVGLPAEGSQVLRVGGTWYVMNITWPREDMRTALVHRAEAITGPWEGRVALHDRGIAQGGLIDTPGGDWYAFLFQDHGAVGRIPYLVPVEWQDGWPVLGEDGVVPETLDVPAGTGGPSGVTGIVASDEFDRAPGDPPLPLAWQWNHNPDDRHWSLSARPGHLRLTTGRVDPDVLHARNTLTQRTFGPESAASTAIDVRHMRDGDVAGLILLQKHYGYAGVRVEGGVRWLVMVAANADAPEEIERVPLEAETVHLRAECDFGDLRDTGRFSYSLDGHTWTPIGGPLKMRYTLPHFMGYRFGLFNFATRSPGGHVDFGHFRLAQSVTRGPSGGIAPAPY